MFEHLRKRWSHLRWSQWRANSDDVTMPESGPENISRYRELRDTGLGLLASGHVDQALESLAAAAALAHRLPEAHINLARAFASTGRWEAARQALDWARILNTPLHDKELSYEIAEQWRSLPKAPPSRKDFEKDQVLHSSLTGNRWTVLATPILGGFGAVYKVRDHDDARVKKIEPASHERAQFGCGYLLILISSAPSGLKSSRTSHVSFRSLLRVEILPIC